MNWDILKVYGCLTPSKAAPCSTPTPPGNPPPPVKCCDDPDYSDSNPNVCGDNPPRLILRPAYALKQPLQQVTYETVLLANGTETVVDTGLTYSSSNGAVAQVGQTGNCSTVGAGIASIAVEYGGQTAYAQIEVIGSCASHQTDFVILIDDSASMGLAFSNQFASKLSFAKQTAANFIDTMDLTKDQAAVFSFSASTANLIQGWTQDATSIKTAINGIAQTGDRTNLKAGLQRVVNYLAGQAAPNRTLAIVLFSDGENKTGGNPLPVAQTFQSGGNSIIVVVGCRAYNGGFLLLEGIASGGFFINAHQATQANVPDWLSGLKGYICSGNCLPPSNICVPYAALNYTGFANWNVTGKVDLIGSGGQPLFDILPGHGLYVDMNGSSAPWNGGLATKTVFGFTQNGGGTRQYRLRFKLAGNQREDNGPYKVRARIANLINTVISITDWKQGFTEYSYDFAGPSVSTPSSIQITTESIPAGANQSYGTLLDDVYLESSESGAFDDTVVIFHDNFDTENLTCFPNNCNDSETPGCGAVQPPEIVIMDYADDLFKLGGCDLAGETFCSSGAAWDGSMVQRPSGGTDCIWKWESSVDGVRGLDSGKKIYVAGVAFIEATLTWQFSLTMVTCTGLAETGLADVAFYSKSCGSDPTGVYTKTSGCADAPGTITIGLPGNIAGIGCGYGCYASGCLDATPLPAQVPDPNPTTDIEPCALTAAATSTTYIQTTPALGQGGTGLGDDTTVLT